MTPDAVTETAPMLNPYAGQRVAVREYTWQLRIKPNLGLLQISIAGLLDGRDWLNPWGSKIMKPDPNNPSPPV